MSEEKISKKLDVNGISKTLATFCGFYLFFSAILPALGFDFLWWNNKSLIILSSFYPGIAPTFIGVLLAFIWGAVSGALFGIIFAWLYNKFI